MNKAQNNFTVYKSSAGSGKTFTLVKEYLRLALADTGEIPQLYRQILATTFTNKAAAEMKSRIIASLKELSKLLPGSTSTMASELSAELQVDLITLSKRATLILSAILHNYTDFAIGTIDSFTHRIVRAFAHDLRLPVNFEIEADGQKLIAEAVDLLISKIGEDEKLTDILIQFSEANAEEGNSWELEWALKSTATNLLNEEGFDNAKKLLHLSIDDFLSIRDRLVNFKKLFEEKVKAIAKNANTLIKNSGLEISDFVGGQNGIAGKFNSYENSKPFKFDGGSDQINLKVNLGIWHSSKCSKASKVTISTIQDQLKIYWEELATIFVEEYPNYCFRELIRKNIYTVALLNEIEKIIFSFRTEQNTIPISDFNRIIAQVVLAEPIPFIYERLGEKYTNYLIDEFQDTSIVQWQNLLPLIENALAGNNFNMVVGDGKQSIYRFRGGEVEQFVKLPYLPSKTDNPLIKEREKSLVRNHGEKYLENNWRSKIEVVDFNNKFFRIASEQLDTTSKLIYDKLEQIPKAGNTGGYVRIEAITTDKTAETALQITKTIDLIEQIRSDGYSYSDIAILVRANKEGAAIATALLEAGIPVLSAESLLLNNSPIVSFMVALLRCIDYPADELASAQVLEYLISTKRINKTLHESLIEFHELANDISLFLKKQNFNFDTLKFARLPIYQRCEELINFFDLGTKSDSYLIFFLDEILNYATSRSKDKIDFFNWWEERSIKASIVVPEGMDAVTVMTIHRAKGLEFPVVIIPFANWKISLKAEQKWVEINDPELPELPVALISLNKTLATTQYDAVYQDELNKVFLDHLNMLYVAMTRPQNRLYIITEISLKTKSIASTVSDLFNSILVQMGCPFVNNIYESGTAVPTIPSEKNKIVCIRPENMNSNTWENSVRIRSTSAEHWKHDDLHGSRDKGNLLHKILADINTKSDIDSAIEKAIQNGIIDRSESEELKQLITKIINIPALENCFSGLGKIRKETELLLPNGSSLRPDRVIENQSETIILDYKTGAENIKYRKQIDNYAVVLKEMGYANISKIIVYTESLKVESWN